MCVSCSPKQEPDILICLGEADAKCHLPAQEGLLGRSQHQGLEVSWPLGHVPGDAVTLCLV